MLPSLRQFAVTIIALLLLPATVLADFEVMLPIVSTQAGSYSVEGGFGKTQASQFLIDTGAGMSTLSRDLFKAVKRTHHVEPVRKIAARLANGQLLKAQVYRIADFRLGKQCRIGAVEVAVMPNAGRNIIGMDILAKTAPFGLNLDKPALAVSQCELMELPPRAEVSLAPR